MQQSLIGQVDNLKTNKDLSRIAKTSFPRGFPPKFSSRIPSISSMFAHSCVKFILSLQEDKSSFTNS